LVRSGAVGFGRYGSVGYGVVRSGPVWFGRYGINNKKVNMEDQEEKRHIEALIKSFEVKRDEMLKIKNDASFKLKHYIAKIKKYTSML